MSNIARDLIFWVESNSALVAGTDLFLGMLPLNIQEGLTFSETGGSENDTNLIRTIVAITSVYKDYDTSIDNLQIIYNLLAYNHGMSLDNYAIFEVNPIKIPGFVTRTDDGDYISSCSVVLNYERT